MSKFTAGNFTVEVTDPYPMWVTVKHGDSELRHFRHTELADLLHVVNRAIAEAERKRPGETA